MRFSTISKISGYFFTPRTQYPLVRGDLNELKRLNDLLLQLNTQSPGDIYTISYTYIFSDEVIRHFCKTFSEKFKHCDSIVYAAGFDKRDGFPMQLFKAKYILVADPIQYDSATKQYTVYDLAQDLLLSRGMGKSFYKLPYEFLLDNSVKIYIYKKYTTIPDAVVDGLSKQFQLYYPQNQKFVFSAKSIDQRGSYEEVLP